MENCSKSEQFSSKNMRDLVCKYIKKSGPDEKQEEQAKEKKLELNKTESKDIFVRTTVE